MCCVHPRAVGENHPPRVGHELMAFVHRALCGLRLHQRLKTEEDKGAALDRVGLNSVLLWGSSDPSELTEGLSNQNGG